VAAESEVFREDGSLQNVFSGMGTARDKTAYTGILHQRFLTQFELESLYKQGIPRRYVDDIPEEITAKTTTIKLGGDEEDPELVKDFETFLKNLNFQAIYAEVMRLQRLYGGAVLVLNIQDGLEPQEPVNVNAIKNIWDIIPLSRYEITPENLKVFDTSKPEVYRITTAQRLTEAQQGPSTDMLIHSSRVIRFDGLYLPWNARKDNIGWGMSCLQLLYEAYKRYETAMSGLEAMVSDSDLFVHKIPGLFNKLAQDQGAGVTKRLELNRLSRSVYGGMAIDTEEEVTFLARALANLASATDPFVKELQAATGWPASILMGESPGGLGKEGRFEERMWSAICAKWQETYCKAPVTKLFEYLFLNKAGPTGGKIPDSWEVEFPPIFTQTEEELATLQGLNATSDTAWINLGVLNALEVRQSRFGGPEYGTEIQLNEAVTSMLEDQQAAQHESTMISMQAQNEAMLNPPEDPAAAPAAATKTDSAEPILYANQGIRIEVTHEVKGAKVGHLVTKKGERTDSTENAPYIVLGGYKPCLPIKRAKFKEGEDTINGPYVAGFYTDSTATRALQLLYPKTPIIGLVNISPNEAARIRSSWCRY
jgi:phage-related protein (TIGR01555 family)